MSRTKSPFELAALATVAVPGLKVVAIRPPSYSDDVVSVTGIVDTRGDKWLVTCPHDTIGGLDLHSQSTVLHRLGQAYDYRKISFDVPRPAGSTVTPEGDRVLVHKDLGGRFLEESDFDDEHLLPASLGRALASLHNLSALAYTGAGLPVYDAQECRRRHVAILDEAAQSTLLPSNLWSRWEAALEDVSLWRFSTVPLHADLQLRSISVDRGSVIALSGFHGAHVGDPATDIAWVLAQASDGFLDRFREAYAMERSTPDLHLFTRAQLVSELALVRWFVHGVHAEDRDIQRDAEKMIRELADDLGDEQLVNRRPSPTALVPSSATDESAQAQEPQVHQVIHSSAHLLQDVDTYLPDDSADTAPFVDPRLLSDTDKISPISADNEALFVSSGKSYSSASDSDDVVDSDDLPTVRLEFLSDNRS
ncbi:phosphotransferase [Schaalia sp. lx-260]|uniref:phosphotransferase n=1 Tax=Schaalia sp. lx-260 TaxID=2899082 RepID=UPI001E3C422E|nr:phosphotransferase [Schaalia sp. lx-260]